MGENRSTAMPTTHRYWIILLAVFLGLTLAKELSARGEELSCWSGGYGQDAWMAYCNSIRYGVYDVEAIWHHVEPEAGSAIQAAKVLTLTDSRLQNTLSLGGASEWFAARHYPLYMLGLPAAESGFGERLIDHFQLHPDVVILDASPYFTGDVGGSERGIFKDPDASRAQVLALKEFQVWHRRFCNQVAWACNHNFAYFRSRRDGHWIFPPESKSIWIGSRSVPSDRQRFPTAWTLNERLPLYPKFLAAARRLVEKLPTPGSCIVITNVPSDDDLRSLASYIGQSLGLTVINPAVSDLYTFDHAHLTPESSARWTRQFLDQLEPVLQRCIARSPKVAADNSRSG